MIDKNSKILIVGHDDVLDQSLQSYLAKERFTAVSSTAKIALDTTIQPSVYDYFQKNRPEYVIVTSVMSGGIGANQKYPADLLYKNSESQNNILYAAWKFGVKKLLYLAASCVYPKDCPQPMKEEYLLTGKLEETSAAYSIAKISGIKLCQAYRRQYGLKTIAAVPATIYGPGSDTDLEKAHVMGALMAKFSTAIKNGDSKVTVWGTGHPRREFLYADDFAEATVVLLNRYDQEELINLGSGQDVTIKDLAQMIGRVSGFKGEIIFDTTMPDGAMQKLLDGGRIGNLGWKPKVGLEEGVRRMWEWCRDKKRGL